jgi:hypothetical protein
LKGGANPNHEHNVSTLNDRAINQQNHERSEFGECQRSKRKQNSCKENPKQTKEWPTLVKINASELF